MELNRLGKAGIKVSELSLGSWITFGRNIDVAMAKRHMRMAFDEGINFFDNAEAYAAGEAERVMGEAAKDFRREDLVISTKLFWGGDGPNDEGLSRKHILEGTRNSLKRLQMEYVDLIFCHRPDPDTPIEETVRAMDYVVRSGSALYWGTSEWSAEQIREAQKIARETGCMPPTMEQPEYHMFHRDRVEKEYAPLYDEFGLGTTIWSPLNSGVLTGKYNNGIPEGSRLDHQEWLRGVLSSEKVEKVKALTAVAEDIGMSMAQLAITWCVKNPHVSTVITGSTSDEQLKSNIECAELKGKLTDDVMARIETILN